MFRHDGRKLLAIVHRNEGIRRRCPAVLFLHGFPGSEKNVDIQRRLMGLGVATFALHFAGAWGSEGTYSFSGLVDQAARALDELRRMDFVDRERVGVFGFSMGGWTAIHLGADDGRLSAVAAVAPVGGRGMVASRTRRFLSDLCAPLRIRSKAELYRDFVETMRERETAESAARLRAPLLVVHSRDDQVVPFDGSKRVIAVASGPKRLVAVDGAGHDFLGRRDWLARLVSHWLARRLGAEGGSR